MTSSSRNNTCRPQGKIKADREEKILAARCCTQAEGWTLPKETPLCHIHW